MAYFREPINDSESLYSFYSSFNKSDDVIYPEIYINGDFELAAAASSGNGTAEYPYIIENETIDLFSGVCFMVLLPGTRIGILIRNTTKHFIIRHCDITIAKSCNNYIRFYGVWLDNVTNGSLINNSIKNTDSVRDAQAGIVLLNCSNVNLSTNIVSNNMFGVFLYDSNFNHLTNNTINSNAFGLYFDTSSNNTISNNSINTNWGGLSLIDRSNFNLIAGNTFLYNSEGIIEDDSCVGNVFEDNIIVNRVSIPPIGWLLPTFVGLGLITTTIYLRKKLRRKK